MSKGPKITIIGAASYFFGKQIIHKMATSEIMAGGTLAMVDTDPHKLAVMMKLARRVFARTRCGVKLLGATRRREVMKDSDFMVLTFSDRNTHFRKLDTEIAARHGIRMCSSDTIGPGGIFRALREIPHVLAMARDARQLAPHSWIINFVNPTAVLGIALRRYATELASFAICDGHHEPYNTLNWCKMAGVLPADATSVPSDVLRKLDLAIAGVNHFTWVLRFRYDGKDMFPVLRRRMVKDAARDKTTADTHSKASFNVAYQLELFDIFGVIPDTINHTKEYVPYYQGYGRMPVKPEPIRLFDADQRVREMIKAWEVTEQYAAGKLRESEFLKKFGSDHASDIMESMWGNLRKPFYINTFNGGAVANMPADAFLELRCDLDMRGPRPLPAGAMPRGVLGLQHQVLDTHELTAQAAVTGDRALLRRAMLADPLCNNVGDADACIRDLLDAERDGLPSYWYK